MTKKVRKTLRNGDRVIITKHITPFGQDRTNLYGMIGVIKDKNYINKSPENAYTMFKVDFGNNMFAYCTAYCCNKVIENTDGYISVLK